MANTLEELPLYSEILRFSDVVNEILQTPALRRNRDLHGQIERATSSIHANMKEGFEAGSDAGFAKFVFIAKGSTAEVIGRMQEACWKRLITDDQLQRVLQVGEPLGRMMGGFIKYLAKSGFTDRGRHKVAPTRPRPK